MSNQEKNSNAKLPVRSYRTKEETIEYFKSLAHAFSLSAHRNKSDFDKGKAEAYEIAAFELERNMR